MEVVHTISLDLAPSNKQAPEHNETEDIVEITSQQFITDKTFP